jgi:translation elongation factor P/translation initiation factor 5A
MKKKNLNLVTFALVPAAMLALTSCSSTKDSGGTSAGSSGPSGATMVAAEKGVPGGVIVETYQATATVTAIDAATRKVTLVDQSGKKTVFKAGPDVVNFDQIRVGDQVKATVTEELAVFMATDAPPQGQGEATAVALAPVGAKPGGLVAEMVQVKATITAIDTKKRKATLQFPDGTTHVVAVRPDVDLTQRHVGEQVVIRCTEALAINVEKP